MQTQGKKRHILQSRPGECRGPKNVLSISTHLVMELLKALMIIFQAVSSSCSDTQICTILHLKYSCHSFHFHVEVSVRSHEKPCLLPYPKRSSSENTSLTCYFFPQKFLILFICLDEKNISSMKGETGEEEMGEHLPKVGREGSPIPAAAAVCCLV